MKRNSILKYIISLCMFCAFVSCDDNGSEVFQSIDLKGTPDTYETLNASDKLEVPVKIVCESGLKKAFYKIVTQEPDQMPKVGDEITIPVEGNVLDTTLTITVTPNLYGVVIAVYDQNDKVNSRTIRVQSVKNIPALSFKDDVKFRKTVCVGIPFNIIGKVQSEHELTSVSLIPVVSGKESTPVIIQLVDKMAVEFTFIQSVPVVNGLEHILLKAENVFGGVAVDTFKVLNVVTSDFVEVVLADNATELTRIIANESSLVSGTITSGSDITSVKYAAKINGSLANLADATLTDNVGNETKFSFNIQGVKGLESVRVVATNNGGKTTTMDFVVPSLRYRLVSLKDVEMSSDPADNKCFLALYESTKVFGVSTALSKQDRIDFYLANKGNGVQPLSPHAYGAGQAYYDASLPYLKGFTELTYAFLSAKRGKITQEAINELVYDYDLDEFLKTRIMAPAPDGENYKILTASRRVGDTFNDSSKKDGGFLLGWGTHTHPTVSPAVVNNVGFAIFYVKSVTKKANGHWKMVFDVKFPVEDLRKSNHSGSITPYEPYPL